MRYDEETSVSSNSLWWGLTVVASHPSFSRVPTNTFSLVLHWHSSCWYHWKVSSCGPDGHEWNMYIEKLAYLVRDIEREGYIFPCFFAHYVYTTLLHIMYTLYSDAHSFLVSYTERQVWWIRGRVFILYSRAYVPGVHVFGRVCVTCRWTFHQCLNAVDVVSYDSQCI